MASQRFCKIMGREMGPLSFRELAEMVRAGTLTQEDPVRRKEAHEWTPAREVIGLFRAAERPPAEEVAPPEAKPSPAPAPAKPKRAIRRPRKLPPVARRALITAACALILVALAATAVRAWMSGRRVQFPARYSDTRQATEADVAELSRPQPIAPSAPGLEPGRPALIPGLEEINPGFSPSLTGDLCTIVFSAKGGAGTGYDLYEARRESVFRPFDKPELIPSCASPEAERFAALSPDGLELLFVRSESSPQLFHARRPSKADLFGEPAPLPMPWLDNMNQQFERAQFCDPSHLALCATDLASGNRAFLFAVRAAEEDPFGPGGKIPLRGRWTSQFFISASGLRTYYAQRQGIFVTARRSTAETFQGSAVIFEAEVTGPIKGPLWVAPEEDVIFYCSPGPVDPPGSARRLWMIGL